MLGRGKKGKKGPWPLAEKAVERLDAGRAAMQAETEMARQRFQAKVGEILELARPDGIPKEATFDGKDAFCMPDDLPDEAKQAMGIAPTEPTKPEPVATSAEDELIDGIGGEPDGQQDND